MKDTQNIAGLRFQTYDTGVVHIHDDARNLKFTAKTKGFKKAVKDFIKRKGDEGALLQGTSTERLFLAKEGKKIFAIVLHEQDIAKDLNSFVDSL